MSEFFVSLPNRGLITVTGTDRKDFLQGLITNDVNKLTPDAPLYACLLTAQGKFLHDFFVIEDGDAILLDCEGGDRAKDLHKRLSMYRLRADVELSIQEENTVYAILESQNLRETESQKNKFGDSEILRFRDSRHPEIGYRSFEKPDLPDLSAEALAKAEKPFEDWDYQRISLTIPDGSRDLIPEKSTMDEGSMDQLNAIDYEKGCYVGQELTARMHYRGLGKKRLKTIRISESQNPGISEKGNSEILKFGDSRILDTRSTCRDIGIALVKIAK